MHSKLIFPGIRDYAVSRNLLVAGPVILAARLASTPDGIADASLRETDAGSVHAMRRLPSVEAQIVRWVLPTQSLSPGSYEVALSAGDQIQWLAEPVLFLGREAVESASAPDAEALPPISELDAHAYSKIWISEALDAVAPFNVDGRPISGLIWRVSENFTLVAPNLFFQSFTRLLAALRDLLLCGAAVVSLRASVEDDRLIAQAEAAINGDLFYQVFPDTSEFPLFHRISDVGGLLELRLYAASRPSKNSAHSSWISYATQLRRTHGDNLVNVSAYVTDFTESPSSSVNYNHLLRRLGLQSDPFDVSAVNRYFAPDARQLTVSPSKSNSENSIDLAVSTGERPEKRRSGEERATVYGLAFAELLAILSRTLRESSSGKHTSLATLGCDAAHDILLDDVVVGLADSSPVHAFGLAHAVLEAQAAIDPKSEVLSMKAIDFGINDYAKKYVEARFTPDDVRILSKLKDVVFSATAIRTILRMQTHRSAKDLMQNMASRGTVVRCSPYYDPKSGRIERYRVKDVLCGKFVLSHVPVFEYIRSRVRQCDYCGKFSLGIWTSGAGAGVKCQDCGRELLTSKIELTKIEVRAEALL